MKSKLTSSWICRARSLRNIVAPLSTPTRMIGLAEKSRVIWAPISATRWAICSLEMRIFGSATRNPSTAQDAEYTRETLDSITLRSTMALNRMYRSSWRIPYHDHARISSARKRSQKGHPGDRTRRSQEDARVQRRVCIDRRPGAGRNFTRYDSWGGCDTTWKA